MKKDKFHEDTLRLLVFVIGIFSICILLLSFKLHVNAETVSSISAPYVVPNYQSLNSGLDLDAIMSLFENSFKPNMAQFYPNVDFDHCIMFIIDPPNVNNGNISIYLLPSPSIQYAVSSDVLYNQFDFMDTTVRFQHASRIFTINTNINNYNYLGSNQYDGYVDLFGAQSTVSRSEGTYTIKYPFLLLGYDNLYDSTGDYVMVTNIVPQTTPVFNTGHSQEPSYDSDTIIDSSLHPNIKPTFPTFTTYNITVYSPPSIDTSNVESLLESIWDIISYTGSYIISNIGGFFNNFWSNLYGLLNYLGDLITYLFNKVIMTIKQSINNIFENFRDLFEPVLNSFANLVNIFNTLYSLGLKDDVFDIPTLFGNLFVPNQSDVALLVDTFVEFDYLQTSAVSIKSLMFGIFDVLNDDAVYSIHVQGFTFHGVTVPDQEISFDWYLPYKATGDIFISAFLIVGYLYWLWTRISGLFHGVVPDSQGASNITVSDHSKEFFGFPY